MSKKVEVDLTVREVREYREGRRERCMCPVPSTQTKEKA